MKETPNSFYNKLPPQLKNIEAPAIMWFELDHLYKEVERLEAVIKRFEDKEAETHKDTSHNEA